MKKWNLGEVYQANQPKKRDPKCSIQLLRPFDHCRYKISLFWFLLSLSHSLSLLLVRRSWFRCCFWRRKRDNSFCSSLPTVWTFDNTEVIIFWRFWPSRTRPRTSMNGGYFRHWTVQQLTRPWIEPDFDTSANRAHI